MKIEKLLTEKNLWIYSTILTVIVLSIIPMVRIFYFDSILPGEIPYYHIKLAEHISSTKDLTMDFASRPYLLNPFNSLLALIVNYKYASSIYLILPFVFGLLSVVLFNLILKKLGIGLYQRFMAVTVLALSPAFIYSFSILDKYFFSLFLFLIGFWFFIQEDKKFTAVSLPIFIILSFFGLFEMLFILFAVISFSIYNKEKIKWTYALLFLLTLITLFYYIPFFYKFGLPSRIFTENKIVNLISDLGGTNGFGVFTLLLFIFGLYLVWTNKKLIIPYLFLLTSLVISFCNPSFNSYLNILISIFAGISFVSIANFKWKIKTIKSLTILIIVCGLLFSTISYLNRASSVFPNKDIINSLKWMKKNSNQNDIIFSYYQNGFWIESISDRKAVLDSYLDYTYNLTEIFNDSNTIFYSRNLKTTTDILNKYNVSYIWIDPEMRYGKVWTKENQGLLFLFRNNQTFTNIYNKNNIEVWKYNRQ